jgi:hypothetical protein
MGTSVVDSIFTIIKAKPSIMDSVPKTFHSIPMHMNPPEDDTAESAPWHCNLSFLASKTDPTSIFAIGIDDPLIDRHLFCTSLSIQVKDTLVVDVHEGDGAPPDASNHIPFLYERPYVMLRRQQNASIGKFLHGLAQIMSGDKRLRAYMMADDGDEMMVASDEEPDDDAVLTLTMQFDVDSAIVPVALAAGLIFGCEQIERIDLRFEFSRTARAEHVAALALMMASHSRLGSASAIGRLLGNDLLRLVCDAYRLRLYECRRNVWSE